MVAEFRGQPGEFFLDGVEAFALGALEADAAMAGVAEQRFDDALLGDDRDMLEDILTAAFNDALRKVDRTIKDKYSGIAAGLNLPGGIKLPF